MIKYTRVSLINYYTRHIYALMKIIPRYFQYIVCIYIKWDTSPEDYSDMFQYRTIDIRSVYSESLPAPVRVNNGVTYINNII